MSSIVEINNVSKEYQLGKSTITALGNINLQISAGEFLALAGRSGSGKTTLLNIIGCIEKPTQGSISINQENVALMSDIKLSLLRARHLGFIFQSFNLLPVLSALENVEYPLTISRSSIKQGRKRAQELLELVGLSKVMHHRPLELSGGQRQRVAIARALIMKPQLVLADEPTANLDVATGQDVLALMKHINLELKTTFVFSTHDPKVIELAQRVVRISDGHIEEDSCSP